MACGWCFSSTLFHDAVNVKLAVYLNIVRLRQLHTECLEALRLSPKKSVTLQNAATLEDDNLPSQRGVSMGVEGDNIQSQSSEDKRCTEKYWMHSG